MTESKKEAKKEEAEQVPPFPPHGHRVLKEKNQKDGVHPPPQFKGDYKKKG